jgi:sortase (surface protein transpeptidase)
VTQNLAKLLDKPVVSGKVVSKTARKVSDWQPPVDDSLPKVGWIKIPAIGVTTEVVEASSSAYEQALSKGVWRVPELGTPADRLKPTILVAHRFGYLSWSNRYRRENSFYNLPKLKVGDRIEIVWAQRKYTYEIYAGDQGTQITDYSADLILYTCQYLESDQRIFKYARLLEQ